jgi:hypothetical protein
MPFAKDCRQDVDLLPELGPKDASYYVSQIGALRWMVALGSVDVITEVSMLALQLAFPKDGHLEAVCRIFTHLNNEHNSCMFFALTQADVNMGLFKDCNWGEFYGDVSKPTPRPTCLNPVARRLKFVCMLTLTVPVINSSGVYAPVSLCCSSIQRH